MYKINCNIEKLENSLLQDSVEGIVKIVDNVNR